MNNFIYFEILGDWLKNLIDRAINIESTEGEFQEGVLQGYYEAISHIVTQIDALGLMDKLNDDYLKNFNPDDLLNGKAKSPFERKSSDGEF